VAESLDRLSRDQEHVAALYKQLSFQGVLLLTIGEGEISELHVGLKGAMSALYLKDLAQKTRRGLEGRIRQGRSAGGLSYGYRIVRGSVAMARRRPASVRSTKTKPTSSAAFSPPSPPARARGRSPRT